VLNREQKIILWAAVVLVVLMGLWPPYYSKGGPNTQYLFFWHMPISAIRFDRLFLQWLCTAVVASGLMYAFKGKKSKSTGSCCRHPQAGEGEVVNRYQKAVLFVGIAVIVLMAFFPPWASSFRWTRDTPTTRFFAGYASIFSPPPAWPPPATNISTRVDIFFRMLVLQWALVAVITGSIVLRLKGKKQE
jgi:hypothetical protein